MDDKSIVSDREQQIEAELEAEKRQANKGVSSDKAGTGTTDAAAPNAMGGGAGVDQTTASAGRVGDFPGAVTTELEEADAYPGSGPGDADQRDVDADERPGETYQPRSG
jgi:hypothetical protein